MARPTVRSRRTWPRRSAPETSTRSAARPLPSSFTHAACHEGSPTLFDELVELSVRRPEVNVTLQLVLSRLIADFDPYCSKFEHRLIETFDQKADTPRRLTHAAGVGNNEAGAVWKLEDVRVDTTDSHLLEAKRLAEEPRHLRTPGSRGTREHEPKDPHQLTLAGVVARASPSPQRRIRRCLRGTSIYRRERRLESHPSRRTTSSHRPRTAIGAARGR